MPKLYTLRSVPGRGLGMFAARAIQAGVRILTDKSLFFIADCNVDEGIEARICLSFSQLSQEQQQQFETLHCPEPHTWTTLVSRFLANSFEMDDIAAGVFLEASRVNHSCCPNAFFAWNGNLNQLTIHAMREIPAGEEITISYEFQFTPFAARRNRFLRVYGFECDCAACHLDNESVLLVVIRRQRMEILDLAIEECQKDPNRPDDEELDMVLEFLKLATDEQMDGQFLAYMYQRASVRYEAKGSMTMALQFEEMELESKTRLLGRDHPLTKECEKELVNQGVAIALQEGLGIR